MHFGLDVPLFSIFLVFLTVYAGGVIIGAVAIHNGEIALGMLFVIGYAFLFGHFFYLLKDYYSTSNRQLW